MRLLASRTRSSSLVCSQRRFVLMSRHAERMKNASYERTVPSWFHSPLPSFQSQLKIQNGHCWRSCRNRKWHIAVIRDSHVPRQLLDVCFLRFLSTCIKHQLQHKRYNLKMYGFILHSHLILTVQELSLLCNESYFVFNSTLYFFNFIKLKNTETAFLSF